MSAHIKIISASDGSLLQHGWYLHDGSLHASLALILYPGVRSTPCCPCTQGTLPGTGEKAHIWAPTAIGIKASPPCSQQDTPNTSAAGIATEPFVTSANLTLRDEEKLTQSSRRRFLFLVNQCVGGRKRNILMNYSLSLSPLEWAKEWR